MNFNVSVDTLAAAVSILLTNPERLGELDSKEKHQAFFVELTELVCNHCGGEVVDVAADAENPVVKVRANDSLPEDGGIWSKVAPLLPFRVLLLEDISATKPIFFECRAVDFAHALEQARNVHPGCQVLCDDVGQDDWSTFYVIFSPSECAKDSLSGFWSSNDGWTNSSQASVYSASDLREARILAQFGEKEDAMLSRLETAMQLTEAVRLS